MRIFTVFATLLASVPGCRGDAPRAPADASSSQALSPANGAPSRARLAPTTPAAPDPAPTINPAPAVGDERATAPRDVIRAARARLAAGDRAALTTYFTPSSRGALELLSDDQLRRHLGGSGDLGAVTRQGRRATVAVGAGKRRSVVVLFAGADGGHLVDLRATVAWREVDPGPDEPLNHPISLSRAVEGIPGEGALTALIATSAGEIRCRLFEHRAAKTVANFVGLARGLRGFRDTKSGAWNARPFYDGLTFHRVVAGVLIQGGDPLGQGRAGPGYAFADELHDTLAHDRAGTLSMANRGPNTNGSQFFITLRPLPELDGRHSVFGACEPPEVLERIGAAPVRQGERPVDPVRIETIRFERR